MTDDDDDDDDAKDDELEKAQMRRTPISFSRMIPWCHPFRVIASSFNSSTLVIDLSTADMLNFESFGASCTSPGLVLGILKRLGKNGRVSRVSTCACLAYEERVGSGVHNEARGGERSHQGQVPCVHWRKEPSRRQWERKLAEKEGEG